MTNKMLERIKEILIQEGYHIDRIKKYGKGNDVSHTMFISNKNNDHHWGVSVTSIG